MLYRIGLVLLLLLLSLPASAEDVPYEVTVNEAFEDSTYEEGLTVSGGNQDAFIYCNEQNQYGTTGCSLAIQSGTYVFEFSEDVYEVGFLVGAVNNSYDVKYYYSDGTDETIQKSGQDNSDFSTMYDEFYKSFTDYNNDEANTDKFITKFEVTLSDISVLDTLYWQYADIPVTTTSSTTTSSTTSSTTTTSTTTTTTLPKAKDVVEDNITTYLAWDKNGCEHPNNPLSYKQYLEAIESGEWFGYIPDDCSNKPIVVEIPEEVIEDVVEEILEDVKIPEEIIEEEVIELTEEEIAAIEAEIKAEEERLIQEQIDAEEELLILEELEDSVIPLEDLSEEELEEFVDIIQEIEDTIEIIEIVEEVIELDIPEEVIIIIEEEVLEDDVVVVVEDKEVIEEVLDEPIQEDVKEKPAEELSEKEVVVAVSEVEEIVEDIVVKEATTEEVVEVLEEVNDVGVQNLDKATEEVQEIVQAVVEEAIENVEELTEEQVEVVAEVLSVETEDVEIIAEAVKSDTVVAEAVEEYVERAVENADVEDYTLADVVTEIQYEAFLENPIEVFVDVNVQDINLTTIGDDMTTDQKEKAQEVVVPVILTRIATMAAFVFRKTL